ncbi:hypothetical protein BCV71DRAFT_242316 [Rhizopus microsporus]|uniref:Uncharacterized protein n=1 Tax=Rhizopus microsporus TaxID=58291 RepID=A0A1X0S834_RHIZD|nr:hypothetical protein BCV71DRAFT_242316 [Rhizopus microsporus]
MTTDSVSSVGSRLNTLVQEKQFYWWLGHICIVLNSVFYFSSVLSFHANPVYYKRAYMGALLSYAIVIYNSIRANKKTFDIHILCDENVHYFVIAFYWYSAPPIADHQIKLFTEGQHNTAIKLAAYIEIVVISLRLVLGIFMFSTSILSIIVFIHFLRLRYYLSNESREAMHKISYYMDQWLLVPKEKRSTTQATVANIYFNIKRFIIRYGGIHTKK